MLTVLQRGPNRQWPNSRPTPTWKCLCDCGTETTVNASDLARGHTQSCGCLHEVARAEASVRHGRTGTYEHDVWVGMQQRCFNPKNRAYPRYGGRGITVCERWRTFENFLADMGEAPDGCTLDRRDNDGPYAPENCRWATRSEQGRNRGVNRIVEYAGERITLVELSERTGIPYGRLCWRAQHGHSGESLIAPRRKNQWG